MICSKCQSEIRDGAKFCGKCGAPALVIKPHFCGRCGRKITDSEDKICAACREKEAAPAPTPAPAPTSAPAPAPAPTPAPAPAPTPAPTPEKPVVKKKKNVLPLVIGILLAAVIVGEGCYYYLVPMGGMEKIKAAMAPADSQPEQSSSEEQPSVSAPASSLPPTTAAPEPTAAPTPAPAAGPAAAPAQDYLFEDWDAKIQELRTKYKPVSADFVPVDGATELSDFKDGVGRMKIGDKWGYETIDGKTGDAIYDMIMPPSEGKMAASFGPSMWGYIDVATGMMSGNWSSAASYRNGYAVVSQDKKFGLVDKNGAVVIEPYYENMRDYSEGLIPACDNGIWGFVDLEDRTKIPFEYSDAGPFISGRAVVTRDGKAFFIDTLGNAVTEEFDDAWSFNENHTAKVMVGKKYGLIDTAGRFLINPQWDNVWNFSEGVATVQRDGRYGYVSQRDNVVTVQPVYSDVWSSGFGLIPVKTANGKWAYVDQRGNTVIPPRYDEAYNFSEGVGRAGIAGRYALIDITGKEICGYDYKVMGYVREGVCPVMDENGTWGYLYINYEE